MWQDALSREQAPPCRVGAVRVAGYADTQYYVDPKQGAGCGRRPTGIHGAGCGRRPTLRARLRLTFRPKFRLRHRLRLG